MKPLPPCREASRETGRDPPPPRFSSILKLALPLGLPSLPLLFSRDAGREGPADALELGGRPRKARFALLHRERFHARPTL